MKYIFQMGIILTVTFIAEAAHRMLPLQIPTSIYGLLIMLFCLKTRIIKVEKIKMTGDFLLEIMPLMFIPAAAELIEVWDELAVVLVPVAVITLLTTVIVMVVTGRTTQFIIRRNRGEGI